MTIADIDLGSGLRRFIDHWIDEVRLGVRRFWRGGDYANAPSGYSASLLCRMQKLLRFAFLILAIHLDLPDRAPSCVQRRAGLKARGPRKPAFRLFGRWRVVFDDMAKRPQPAALARAAKAPRDPVLTARRRLDALTRALADPLPIVRRMARRLPTQLMVFGWRPPKRLPPRHRRDFCELLADAFAEARHHLSAWRRRRLNIAAAAPGS